MWYGFLDGCVAIESKKKAQKVQNLLRNPNMTVLVEDGETYETLRGVTLIGKAEIIELLRQRSRPYLFSNTLAPVITATSPSQVVSPQPMPMVGTGTARVMSRAMSGTTDSRTIAQTPASTSARAPS